MSLDTGQILLDRYQINQTIGRGGFGAVYQAYDKRLNITVAVKENLQLSPQSQKQFEREGHLLARLSHPNLPRVIDHFVIPHQGQYLVMDFIEGQDLRTILNQHGIVPTPQALTWIIQICNALSYLHSRTPPIIHRDIKPANIKIQPDGQAILVDFGIAKLYDPDNKTTMGAKGVTHGFSPPEQYGGGHTDVRSDVYALGATLYSLLTRTMPPDSVQRMLNHVTVPPLPQLNPTVTLELDQVIATAIELPIEKRFQTMAQFQTALEQTTRRPLTAKILVNTPPPQNWRKISYLGVAILITLLLLGGGFIIAISFITNSSPTLPTPTKIALLIPPTTPPPTSTPSPTMTPPPPPTATMLPSHVHLAYLIDGSNSMLEPLSDGQAKISAVQTALAEHWLNLPQPPPNISLWAYGHRFDALNQNQSCVDIELLLPLAQGQSEALITTIKQITPRGRSPLAEAIKATTSDFNFTAEQHNALIILADSGDSCGFDPCQMLKTQREVGLFYPVYVIGLGVDAEARQALRCLAEVSEGRYQEAYSTSELIQVLNGLAQVMNE